MTVVRDPGDGREAEERKLVAEFKLGSQPAFETLELRCRRRIAAIAEVVVGDPVLAQQIVPNVLANMRRMIHYYNERQEFYRWVDRITVNTSHEQINRVRTDTRHRLSCITGHRAKSHRTKRTVSFAAQSKSRRE